MDTKGHGIQKVYNPKLKTKSILHYRKTGVKFKIFSSHFSSFRNSLKFHKNDFYMKKEAVHKSKTRKTNKKQQRMFLIKDVSYNNKRRRLHFTSHPCSF